MARAALVKFRIWIVNLAVLTVVLTMSCYASYASSDAEQFIQLFGKGWASIVLSFVILISYSYAIKGRHSLQKFLRAFLLLAVSVGYLYVNVSYLVTKVNSASGQSDYKAFQCPSGDTPCYLCWAYTFMCVITGLFVLVELFWALTAASLESNTPQYGHEEHRNLHQMQLPATGPEQKLDDPNHASILQPAQPYIYPQESYIHQQPVSPQSSVPPQSPGFVTYTPKPFVPHGQ